MPREADPLLTPNARADLARVSRLMQDMLLAWMRRIINSQVDPSSVRDVLGSRRDPPWRWSRFAGYAIVCRFLADAELQEQRLFADQMLVARIVEMAYLADVFEEVLAEEAAQEAAEEAEETALQGEEAARRADQGARQAEEAQDG